MKPVIVIDDSEPIVISDDEEDELFDRIYNTKFPYLQLHVRNQTHYLYSSLKLTFHVGYELHQLLLMDPYAQFHICRVI